VDWKALDSGISGSEARQHKKSPRPHQEKAIAVFHEHFQTKDRGKLIMACGTGKTFTSLKIMEKETGGRGVVLFLAPSIALVGQTLREWTAESSIPIFPICICSDPEVSKSKKKSDDDTDGYSVTDLAFPASTRVTDIVRQFRLSEKFHKDGVVVVFSTYQSIAVVANAQKEFQRGFDLIICDEAHRTTGVTLKLRRACTRRRARKRPKKPMPIFVPWMTRPCMGRKFSASVLARPWIRTCWRTTRCWS